ncbi:MAG: hypothetical protein CMB87_04820 [Flammeovirgaceae bacterium]|nr:hypothetical protein [Flammeovirgaceae bacterium]
MDNKNDDLDYNKIGNITSDFIKVSDQIKITCKKIIEKKFSKFPIIIMSKENTNLGTLLIDQNEILGNEWKYFASYAEVLNKKKIISNLSVFQDKYKNPEEFCCLLTKIDINSKIIFIPYPED